MAIWEIRGPNMTTAKRSVLENGGPMCRQWEGSEYIALIRQPQKARFGKFWVDAPPAMEIGDMRPQKILSPPPLRGLSGGAKNWEIVYHITDWAPNTYGNVPVLRTLRFRIMVRLKVFSWGAKCKWRWIESTSDDLAGIKHESGNDRKCSFPDKSLRGN